MTFTKDSNWFDGTAFRSVCFGDDDFSEGGWTTVAYEMGHVFGLPDLYLGGKKDTPDRKLATLAHGI